jgi:hypothetical protein
MLCLGTDNEWVRELRVAGIPVAPLGHGLDNVQYREAGGYRFRSGELRRHHFLAIEEEQLLFDPTAGQLLSDGPIRIQAYELHTGARFVDVRDRIVMI